MPGRWAVKAVTSEKIHAHGLGSCIFTTLKPWGCEQELGRCLGLHLAQSVIGMPGEDRSRVHSQMHELQGLFHAGRKAKTLHNLYSTQTQKEQSANLLVISNLIGFYGSQCV